MKRKITAFYLETLLLIAVFVMVILALVSVFGIAKEQSTNATRLTEAVQLSVNAAEAVAASDDIEGVRALLDEDGQSEMTDGALLIHRDGYDIRIPDLYGESGAPSVITVSRDGETIYSLETWVAGAQEVAE